MVIRVEGNEKHDRAKDFVLDDVHVGIEISEEGGRVEDDVFGVLSIGTGALSTSKAAGSIGDGVGDKAINDVDLSGHGHGSTVDELLLGDHTLGHGRSLSQGKHLLLDGILELIIDLPAKVRST